MSWRAALNRCWQPSASSHRTRSSPGRRRWPAVTAPVTAARSRSTASGNACASKARSAVPPEHAFGVALLNASGCLDALTAPATARQLDAFVTKTVTPLPRAGNAPVRIAETAVGMLNSIGLANPGIDTFLAEHLTRLAALGLPLWVSVGGFSLEDYVHVAERLAVRVEVDTIELNLSCPNVDEVPENVGEVVAAVRALTDKPLSAKLSAAVPDVGATARAAETAGADGLSLVNTVKGLALDERTLRPVLARAAGGLSGPALRPVALAAVHTCARETRVPIVGM